MHQQNNLDNQEVGLEDKQDINETEAIKKVGYKSSRSHYFLVSE